MLREADSDSKIKFEGVPAIHEISDVATTVFKLELLFSRSSVSATYARLGQKKPVTEPIKW